MHSSRLIRTKSSMNSMLKNLYYIAPIDAAFDDMKQACIEVWQQYEDQGGMYDYMEEKLSRIRDIKNIEDNFMYMLAMFDMDNQKKVIEKLKAGTQLDVRERLLAGGNDETFIQLLGL